MFAPGLTFSAKRFHQGANSLIARRSGLAEKLATKIKLHLAQLNAYMSHHSILFAHLSNLSLWYIAHGVLSSAALKSPHRNDLQELPSQGVNDHVQISRLVA